ncbi:hypothetical protein WBK31_23765 [Nonomuraea sp. N2-4H]|uniref:hypothetical protein n=1 Tax=Nonomuraea sp. N2-4H TaxID=3128898 RepID=UPI003254034F
MSRGGRPRPRDRELGRVWMRDTYVNCFIVRGRPLYVATGTTRVPGLQAAGPWNDGIFVWTAPSLRGPWRLVDTTRIRPGAEKGKVWSPEFVNENREGRTVVAPWQEYWSDERFGKRGQVWAPEVHCFRGKWYIVACMGDHSRKVGSFLLVSEGGIEGPYRLAEGNLDKPFGESFIGGPDFIEPGAYHHIDGSTRHAYDPPGPGRTQYQYDAVVAVADRFEGPYSKRWTLGVGAGHNNLFRDHAGRLWATFFRNPNAGYWADPSRTGDAAVPGVVRLEWTGPRGDRLYVQRRRGH